MLGIQLFLLMGSHLALPRFAHAKTFFGVRKNHGRLAFMGDGCCIGCENFYEVMATAFEPIYLLISHALH